MPCVNYHYNEELKLIYLTAPRTKKRPTVVKSSSQNVEMDDTDIYVPTMAFNDIDLNTIETIQRTLCPDVHQPNVILAIVDSNSTILYYRMTNGLLDLNTLMTSWKMHERRSRFQRFSHHTHSICRNDVNHPFKITNSSITHQQMINKESYKWMKDKFFEFLKN